MLVTIDTLNSYDLEIGIGQEKKIASLVRNNERHYLNLSMSVALSAELTETTKDDPRFKAILDASVANGYEYKGLDYGVNYYIYAQYVISKEKSVSSSSVSIQNPQNSERVDPIDYINFLMNEAAFSSEQAKELIEDDLTDYPEYNTAYPLDYRSDYNF